MTRSRARRADATWDSAYLVALLMTVVVTCAIWFLWPAAEWFGESAASVAGLAVLGVAAVLWIPYRPVKRWNPWTDAFFVVVLALWAYVSRLSLERGEVVGTTIVAMPVVVALLWLKRPSPAAVRRAVDVLAWATAVLMLGALVLQLVGVLDKSLAGSALDFDREHYWLPLSGILGIDGRWLGPMRWPNVTASAAVLLIVYGAVRGWRTRIVLIGTGALVLLLTGTRSSMLASVAGLAVLAVFSRRRKIVGIPKRVAVVAVAAVGVLYLGAWLIRNPNITGRGTTWPTYFELWRTSPFTGVGDAGVGLLIQDGRLPGWATTATSIYFDPLARLGVVAFLLVAAALVIATVLAWRAARAGEAVGLALIAALLVGGMTETLFDWRYVTFQVQLVLVVILLASRTSWADAKSARGEQPQVRPEGTRDELWTG